MSFSCVSHIVGGGRESIFSFQMTLHSLFLIDV